MEEVGHGAWTVGVLGPLEVAVDGRVVEDLGGPRLRLVLALLAADAGRAVSVAALVESLWRTQAPPDAARTARTYVSRLRRTLRQADAAAENLIVTRPPGYALRREPEMLDARRFERLAAAGRRALDAGQPDTAAERLASALALWRGEAYGEFTDSVALHAEGTRLARLRLTAVQDRIAADLASGKNEVLVAELEGLLARHPGHERLWGQLMTALYRAGRQADALSAFHRAREVLIEGSGLEPSAGLAEIHRQVLAQDSRLLLAPVTFPAGAPAARPAQLPPAVRSFTGRGSELTELEAVLPGKTAPVAIAIVSGTAGVGKTALAVHWAHRVAARFPDGQLYVNLRGFGTAGSALDPADALRGFLRALGVPEARLPVDRDALTGLYRSVLAGKQVLVVLDNAGELEQVRSLLPGSPGCLVVVTSRHRFTPLVAVEGAHALDLGLLPHAEARDLLVRRLGPDRVASEPLALEAIIEGCARLPLALAIAAAQATSRPGFRLATLVAQLRDATSALDTLRGGDPATDVRAVFSWSYHALSTPAARMFRLLGLHPCADIGTAAAASLAGIPLRQARTLLAELTGANLLTEHSPGRFGLHDLLRAYATEQATVHDADDRPHTVLRRLLDHYLHTAHAAALLLHPHRFHPFALTAPEAGTTVGQPADVEEALAWFTTERPAILTVLGTAVGAGADTHTCRLAWSLSTFLERQGHWHDLAATQRAALAAARRLADRHTQAQAHQDLAGAEIRLGGYADAHTHLRSALALFTRLGDRAGQAHTHLDLAWLFERQSQHAEALGHASRALGLFTATGHQDGQARALNQIGWCHAQLDDHHQALSHCRQALALHRKLGDRAGEAHTWDSLGHAHHHLGASQHATACYQHALRLFRQLGDRYNEAGTLTHLGNTHHATDNPDAAHTTWNHALAILSDLDHPGVPRSSRLVTTSTPAPG
ncbi:BTAD domain-containing putative transcriptional regulator [Amycolatopsis sp. lyj-112]|uniref:AfsR/SARP family transcriptional regulator n=1 Tax=Amycolatopsis sp. lyj-112 TaxID=2789288 RepID=UPI00397C313E